VKTLLLSLYLALAPPEHPFLNRGVDPVWLFVGMAIGSVVSAFAVTGIFLATTPRAFNP
jgi:hypothetical protein